MRFSAKKVALMVGSVVLMLASYVVDGAIADADTRDLIREELAEAEKKKTAEVEKEEA